MPDQRRPASRRTHPRARRTAGRARARVARPRAGAFSAARARTSAQLRLRKFRQGSLLAVAITGLFLIVWGIPVDTPAQTTPATAVQEERGADTTVARADPGRSVEEATSTLQQLANDFAALLPKVLIAVGLLIAAGLLVRIVRGVLGRVLGQWERAAATTALAGVAIWLLALGVALSIIAGDARALVGSVGLLGLALSWALQAPIESFAGWLLNSFKGYYRVGDRIAVGEVFGDVYRIDVMNTTVWEAGGPDKAVRGAQPTGALITFPNSDVLRANIINYTRGFPYVWDEVTVGVSNESDIGYAMRVVAELAREVVGPGMAGPVDTYRSLLESEGLAYDVADEPQVYVAQTESWTDLTIRYLVGARERRKWSSALLVRLNEELARDEHRERIVGAYPVTRVDLRRDIT
jgi:small conductance mechanosensitive channel